MEPRRIHIMKWKRSAPRGEGIRSARSRRASGLELEENCRRAEPDTRRRVEIRPPHSDGFAALPGYSLSRLNAMAAVPPLMELRLHALFSD